MVPAIDPEHRAQLVGNVRKNVPAPVFDQLLAGMRGTLSACDYAKLESALGMPAGAISAA